MDTQHSLQRVNQDQPAFTTQLAPQLDWHDMGDKEHFVQFYEDDTFLVRSVSAFIGSGLRAGKGAIVIATPTHRAALEEHLQAQGFDTDTLCGRGHYVRLDAAATLAKFMVAELPDEDLFMNVVGGVVAQVAQRHANIHAFGEMVALLWAAGNAAAAVRLEELWNELGKRHAFALFCAYPMQGFHGEANGRPLAHICKTHTRVIPAESYSAQSNVDMRLLTITSLQQKAASLEAEIAERRKAEAELREQQAKLTLGVAAAQLGVWELDIENDSLTCSAEYKAHFGLPAEALLSYTRIFELIHPEDRAKVASALRNAIITNADYNTEYRVITPIGDERWIAALGRCFSSDSGHRMLGVTQDITERKRAAHRLEQTVAERTDQLQETIAELEAFSYSISHDMRAPLRSMQGYADILMQESLENLSPECRTYLERITNAAGRMDRLIQDVLTLSQTARAEFNLEPVCLNSLIRDILATYPNLQAPQADISVQGSLPPVLGNEAALTQCFSNLLGNAVKFVSPGIRPHVHIWAELISDEKMDVQPHGVRLFIQDNGIGIPREAQDKIFAMFQRLSKDHHGTGIGLTIVKKAAERMGGKVGVRSEPGHGSTFWLELRHAASPLE